MNSEGSKPLQASKWLKHQMLVDSEEMKDLFHFLGDFHLFITGAVCKAGEEVISRQKFLETYREYVEILKKGSVPDLEPFRKFFSVVMTANEDAVFSIPLSRSSEGKCEKLIQRVRSPCIQLQAHQMNYSTIEKKFLPMVFGTDNILWGVQFSYPSLFFDPDKGEVLKTLHQSEYPNTQLYQKFQTWIRKNTIPTPFVIEGKRLSASPRIGKACLAWIGSHQQLKQKNIQVEKKQLSHD